MSQINRNKKSLTRLASAVSLAIASMLLMPNAQAGRIADTTGICVGASTNTACVGAWNLGNVQVDLIRVLDGSVFDAKFDETTGVYVPMAIGDSFVSNIYNDTSNTSLMAKLSGKVWPIGEPTGIKAVNNDLAVKNGKPANCLINTAYLEGFYLDSTTPRPVVCSSPFQSHKRFKVALQPATVDGVTSGDGKPVDLVFNAANDSAVVPYQVFSKINNYTGKRLAGYKVEVGVGVGANFKTATDLGISDQLYLSLGIGEGTTGSGGGITPSDIFEPDGLATYSGPLSQDNNALSLRG